MSKGVKDDSAMKLGVLDFVTLLFFTTVGVLGVFVSQSLPANIKFGRLRNKSSDVMCNKAGGCYITKPLGCYAGCMPDVMY